MNQLINLSINFLEFKKSFKFQERDLKFWEAKKDFTKAYGKPEKMERMTGETLYIFKVSKSRFIHLFRWSGTKEFHIEVFKTS